MKTVKEAINKILQNQSRYAIRGWRAMDLARGWGAREKGAEALLIVDDLNTGEVLLVSGVPEEFPLVFQGIAGKMFAANGGKAKSDKKREAGKSNLSKARGARWPKPVSPASSAGQ